jgi:DNA adenine methylase
VDDPDVSESSTATQPRLLRPPLKWAGGKRWLVPHLLPYWTLHSDRRLVEPFCGGLAVTLGLSPRKAVLNDRNPHLIHFYCWLKKGLLVKSDGPVSNDHKNMVDLRMENDEKLFYAHRRRFNELLGNGGAERAETAALFYYLNRTGFNGLCRFNKSGEFNVPFGDYNRINYTRDFTGYRQTFEKWEFTSGDFEEVPLKAGDFIYADPPYDVEFTHYSKEGFGWNEQVRAAEWLSRHKGPVILSNQATDRIKELYQKLGFQLSFLQAPRRISCTGDRTPAKEVLAFRNLE